MDLIDSLYRIEDRKLTTITVAVFFGVVIFFGWVFNQGILTITLATPLLLAVVLSAIGGAVTGICSGILLALMAFYFIPDNNRLAQSVISNVIMVTVVGFLSSWAKYQYRLAARRLSKSEILDRANGNLLRLEAALKWVEIAIDNYPGGKNDPGNKGLIALEEARGILADLQTMVKGWRALYKEKLHVMGQHEILPDK